MIIQVYGETVKDERVINFKLVQAGRDIQLLMCNEAGEEYDAPIVLSILPTGVIELAGEVNPDVGLKITKTGYVKVVKD